MIPGFELQKQIDDLQRKWIDAANARDPKLYDALMAPDFFCVSIEGLFLNRAEYLLGVSTATRTVSKLSIREKTIHFYGDSAIVSGIIDVEAQAEGREFSGPIRITMTWVRMAGEWKAACYHTSDFRVQSAWEKLFKK